jgi:CubicO group peptidase (beta-lactamase class C family)
MLGVSAVMAFGCSRTDTEAPPAADAAREVTGELEQLIPRLLQEHATPGLGIALIRDAQVVWARGFGVADAETGTPVDERTIFEAASMSKPVFAYAVMKLAERGLLDLDAPLAKYLDERPLSDPRWNRVTARHLLSHRSGLPNWRTPQEPLALAFEPGERWQYSGEGYFYLQSAITRMTGGRIDERRCGSFEMDLKVCATDIGDYLATTLLRPFGMTSSFYDWDDAVAPRVARGHDEKGLPRKRSRPNPAAMARYASAGGLQASPSDYARFLIEVIAPRPADEFRLRVDTRDEMIRPVVEATGAAPGPSQWALGWQVMNGDHPVIAHGGNQPGFNDYAAASVAHRSGYVIMTNGDNGYAVLSQLFGTDAIRRVLRGWTAAA